MFDSAIKLPLVQTPDGAVRVGKTRVTFLTVMDAYHSGAGAEEIVEQYPALDLADVYATIAYYLQNRAELDAYLAGARQQTQETYQAHRQPGLRARLEARLAQRK